jgi:tetratricopeptide (TPR) repeat protein
MAQRPGFSPSERFKVGTVRAMLVGRAAEMRQLEDALGEVRETGVCLAATVLGAAGVGKSRLVRDFLLRTRANANQAAPRVYRGQAKVDGPAYEVFARALRARFSIVEGMDPEAAKALVRAQAAQVLEDRKVGDVVYFIGQLIELEFHDSPLIKAVEGDALQLRLLRRAVIKHFLEADALHAASQTQTGLGVMSPIILVFDDLQNAHEESLDLIAYLVENVRAPVLIICVARPEMSARRDDWLRHGGTRHTLIEISPLSETDATAVMHELLAPCGDSVDIDDLIDAAATLAGGNPALLEQMVRIFLDNGVLEVNASDPGDFTSEETWTIRPEKMAQVRLPLTVEDAVQARIGSLSPSEREVLERAAAMGGVFWLGGLVSIVRQGEPAPELWQLGAETDVAKLRGQLEQLTERDYILRLPDSTFAGDEEYVFKHNLEREALLKLTAPATARRYHQTIADWIAFKDSAKSNEEYMAMLARHREKAGLKALAGVAYIQAADAARSQYANATAVEYYAKGLKLFSDAVESKVPSVGTRPSELKAAYEGDADVRLRAMHNYGDVLQLLGRNDEAHAMFRDMLALAYRLGLHDKGGAAHSRIGRLYRETGRLVEAENHLAVAQALFEAAQDERGIASTLDDSGKLQWLRGDYAKALEFTQRALAMRRKLGDRRSIALSLNNLGLVHQDSGQFKSAVEAFDQALTIRREIGDLVGVSVSLNNLGTVAQDQRDDARALTLFQEAHEVAKETGDRNRIALILTNLGETYNRLGNPVTAIHYLKQAEELADELGDTLGLAEAVRGLGKAYLARGELTKARECTSRSVELFMEIQSRVQLGVALRSLGQVTAAGSADDKDVPLARQHFLKSVAIFEEIGNEIELARSCRAYSEMLKTTTELQADTEAMGEAYRYGMRANEIFARLRLSSSGLHANVFGGGR